jgi:aryl carrier-like protein
MLKRFSNDMYGYGLDSTGSGCIQWRALMNTMKSSIKFEELHKWPGISLQAELLSTSQERRCSMVLAMIY